MMPWLPKELRYAHFTKGDPMRGGNLHTKFLYVFIFLGIQLFGCGPVKYTIPEGGPKYLHLGEEEQVRVLAAGDWRNSGVMMRKGEKYKIIATGKWHVGGLCGWCGGDGIGFDNILCWDLGGIVRGFPGAALIGKIGEEGTPFGVGADLFLQPDSNGTLFFRCNDYIPGDNRGALTVKVTFIERISEIAIGSAPEEEILQASAGSRMRPRIAVLSFKPSTKVATEEGYGDTVSEMLTTGLIKAARFEVLERTQVKQILDERRFAETEIVLGESAVNAGKMLRVKYLVIGSVAKLGNLIEVDVRFVETESGKALIAENVGCQGVEGLRNAINSLVNKISASFTDRLIKEQ